MQVQVDILTQVITARYGTLNEGDTLRTDAAYAEHLIHECHCAKYSTVPVAPTPAAAVEVLQAQLVVSGSDDVQTSALDDPWFKLGVLAATKAAEAEVATPVVLPAAAAAVDFVQTSALAESPIELDPPVASVPGVFGVTGTSVPLSVASVGEPVQTSAQGDTSEVATDPAAAQDAETKPGKRTRKAAAAEAEA